MTARSRRRTTLAAAIATALAVVLWWTTPDRSPRARRSVTTPSMSQRPLDLVRFRALLAERRARAQALRARKSTIGDARVSRTGTLGASMVSPSCILGPVDLCAAVADTVADCDAGDGAACLAVGQYLDDLPPRPLTARSFFFYACRHGEQAGCDRLDALKVAATSPRAPCADDPLACAWQGLLAKDPAQLDEACTQGVADACAWVAAHYVDDPARARAYRETGCELGSPLICNKLARRL